MTRRIALTVLAMMASAAGVTVRGKLTRFTGPGNVVKASGVTVVLWRGDMPKDRATTGQDGMYYFLDVPPGDYRLEVTPPAGETEFAPLEHEFSVEPDVEAYFDIPVLLLLPPGPREIPPGPRPPNVPEGDRKAIPRLAALDAAQAELRDWAREEGERQMGPGVEKYMKGNEEPEGSWDAGFVSWCYAQARTGIPFKYSFSSAQMARRFAVVGWLHPLGSEYQPQPGDVSFIPGGPTGFRHCGIVVRVEGEDVHVIEGNTNDEGKPGGHKVCELERARGRLAFGHVPDDFIKIHASSRPLEGRLTVDGRQMFRFSLWITAPPERLEGIAKVSYRFEHPTFKNPLVSSDDRQSGFRVHYDGWGTIEVVTVTFTRFDGTSTRQAFAMTDALGSEE
jgi:hypothetical protein